MGLKDKLNTATAAMYDPDKFGTAITYNGAPINAIVKLGEQPDKLGHHKMVDVATARVLRADVATPEYDDQAVFEGATWRMKKIIRSGHNFHLLRFESGRRRAQR